MTNGWVFPNDRKSAAKDRVEMAWLIFNNSIADTAMQRFNQAWLLDRTNADVYWGFGNLLGMKGQYKESISLFKKSISLNAKNQLVWEAGSISYIQVFFKTQNLKQLDTCIIYLNEAIKLDNKNAGLFAELATAYSYFYQKDSARKYMEITDKLDVNAMDPQAREIIIKK